MRFEEIIGYQTFKDQLRQLVQYDRLPHAVLFDTEEGYPALHLAVAWGQYINCTGRKPGDLDSCGQCPNCKKVQAIAHPDMLYIYPVIKADREEPASELYADVWRTFISSSPYTTTQEWIEALDAGNRQPVIYVNDINNLISQLYISTSEAGWRIIVIYQPDRMMDAAANKLLKSLEEPPARTLFILVTSHRDQMLDTIMSRVQHFEVPPMGTEEMAQVLRKAEQDLSDTQLDQLLQQAEGNPYEALSLLSSRAHQERINSYIAQCRQALEQQDILALKLLSEEIAETGREECVFFLRSLLLHLGHEWRKKLLRPEAPSERAISQKQMGVYYSALESAMRDIRGNVGSKIVLFDTFLRMLSL